VIQLFQFSYKHSRTFNILHVEKESKEMFTNRGHFTNSLKLWIQDIAQIVNIYLSKILCLL